MQRWVIIVVLAMVLANGATGQAPSAVAPTVALIAGEQGPSYGAPRLLGIGLGVQRRMSAGVALRGSVSWVKGVSSRSGLSSCVVRAVESSECYLPAYARWYALLGVDGIVMLPSLDQAYAFVGVGWTQVSGEAYSWGEGPPTETQPIASRAVGRVGAGIALGRSVRAPTLELSRALFAQPIGTAKRVTELRLWLR